MNLIKRLARKEYIPLYIGMALMSSPSLFPCSHRCLLLSPKRDVCSLAGVSAAHLLNQRHWLRHFFGTGICLIHHSHRGHHRRPGIFVNRLSYRHHGRISQRLEGGNIGWDCQCLPVNPDAADGYRGGSLPGTGVKQHYSGYCRAGGALPPGRSGQKTKQLKQTPFVESLVILSAYRNGKSSLKHIFPNLTEIALAKYIMSVGSFMLMEAALSFLGLGDPTKVTWAE